MSSDWPKILCNSKNQKFIVNRACLAEVDEIVELINVSYRGETAITFEDPKFTEDGELIQKSRKNYENLKEIACKWMR